LRFDGAAARNLKNLSVTFPLGAFTCVTGVSGSGKSTLVMETLVPKLRAVLAARPWRESSAASVRGSSAESTVAAVATRVDQDASAGSLTGSEQIDRLVEIDQTPLGRNARSNPATASGMWDELRKIFARTRDARLRGFRSGRFSFNAPGGRCEDCRGLGTHPVTMQFLPDIDVICPVCRGARFNRQTLHVKFHGKSVADMLDMRIDEAAVFFENFAALSTMLKTFVDVGLGYLTLGQSAATLSGGEAQRIKLATELGRRHLVGPNAGRTLYVLDEPTTGLHPADIKRLLDLLEHLVDGGHTVIVVEHQLDVIARADWVIDLGPEAGNAGGQIVAAGTPEQIARVPESHTGQALRAMLPQA
jgi:excinuclease ABC subunit A